MLLSRGCTMVMRTLRMSYSASNSNSAPRPYSMSWLLRSASTRTPRPALEVDDLQHAVRHDDQIARTETLRYIFREVQPVFHQNQRIGAGRAHGFNRFDAEIDVLVGDAFGSSL